MIHTPSKNIPLARLREIQADNGISQGGKEYAPDELEMRINELAQSKADAIDFTAIATPELTREQWLLRATDALRGDLFKRNDADIPEVRVSVGFPGGGSARKRIGEYWAGKAVSDGIPQIFVSPTLEDPVQALEVLVHELVHAVHPTEGHKGKFKRLAVALGLTGPMTATVAGPELKAYLSGLSEALGPYPNSQINLRDRKKQSTRLCKVQCEGCEYTARVTRKWLDEAGAPICPSCNIPLEQK